MERCLLVVALVLSVYSVDADGKLPVLSSADVTRVINGWFTGSEDVTNGGKGGVFLRQMGSFDIFCGKGCYRGRPDCTISASYVNPEIGVSESKFTGIFPGVLAGVVFNAKTVNEKLANCFHAFDGGAWRRYNGGCGCYSPSNVRSCDNPHSPFANVGPDGKVVYGDTPLADRCRCKSEKKQHINFTRKLWHSSCFWRGPAYNTSKGLYGKSEFEHFINERTKHKEQQGAFAETVLNAKVVEKQLEEDPVSVVIAIYFIKSGDLHQNYQVALGLQRQFSEKYRVELPIVVLDPTVTISSRRGPFEPLRDAPTIVV